MAPEKSRSGYGGNMSVNNLGLRLRYGLAAAAVLCLAGTLRAGRW